VNYPQVLSFHFWCSYFWIFNKLKASLGFHNFLKKQKTFKTYFLKKEKNSKHKSKQTTKYMIRLELEYMTLTRNITSINSRNINNLCAMLFKTISPLPVYILDIKTYFIIICFLLLKQLYNATVCKIYYRICL